MPKLFKMRAAPAAFYAGRIEEKPKLSKMPRLFKIVQNARRARGFLCGAHRREAKTVQGAVVIATSPCAALDSPIGRCAQFTARTDDARHFVLASRHLVCPPKTYGISVKSADVSSRPLLCARSAFAVRLFPQIVAKLVNK